MSGGRHSNRSRREDFRIAAVELAWWARSGLIDGDQVLADAQRQMALMLEQQKQLREKIGDLNALIATYTETRGSLSRQVRRRVKW